MSSRVFHSVNIIGFVLLLATLFLSRISVHFSYDFDFQNSPILGFVCLLIAMSLLSLSAMLISVSSKSLKVGWKTIVGFAVAMRLVTLFSTPILEIDYYRYLWDGETVLVGVSPYDYSPKQVLEVPSDDSSIPQDLQKLAKVRDLVSRNEVILTRIHYGELPSIYPPVSQAVFAISCWTIPDAASVEQAIVILKAWIVLFDVGVVLLLCRLFAYLNLSMGWAIGYAWSPLVIKEFANSGHLDAIAVFFSVLAVWLFVSGLYSNAGGRNSNENPSNIRLIFAAIALGLSIGAKLYPVIFVPIFLFTTYRNRGFRVTSFFVLSLGIATVASCWPQLGPNLSQVEVADVTSQFDSNEISTGFIQLDPESPPPPPNPIESDAPLEIKEQNLEKQPEQKSLKVFLTQWKMNDLLFHFVESNLTPEKQESLPIWFVITPVDLRNVIVDGVSQFGLIEKDFVPFFLTRFAFAVLFCSLAIRWAWRASRTDSATEWLHAVFLTVAWFWILLPTLNPWYWIWAMPFLTFSQRRAWYLIGVLVLLYYLRFWFQYNWDGVAVWGTPYEGEQFFHHVFVWIEHLPWMLFLMFESFFAKPIDLCNGIQSEDMKIG